MNLNRLRPTGVSLDRLDEWLSGVVWDAARDCLEAGMPTLDAERLLALIARSIRSTNARLSCAACEGLGARPAVPTDRIAVIREVAAALRREHPRMVAPGDCLAFSAPSVRGEPSWERAAAFVDDLADRAEFAARRQR